MLNFCDAMDQSWTNYCVNGYLQSVPPGDRSSNLNLPNVCWGFKPRAYVNPKLVSCLYPFPLVNNALVPKKIHINPNFKPAYYQSASAQAKSDIVLPHINPHFCRTNANFNSACKQGVENLQVNTSTLKEKENSQKLKCSPEKRTQDPAENHSSTPYISGKSQLSTNTLNSTYFWSKQNALPSYENISISHNKKSDTGSYKTTEPTKRAPLYSTSIKTRRKIVNGVGSSNIYKTNKIINRKVQHRNPYKIVNTEQRRLDNFQRSEIYSTPKKVDLSKYSKSNVIYNAEKEPAFDPEKFDLTAKMKISNINHAYYINKITNLIRTKYMYLNKRKQLKLLNIGNYKLDKRKKNASFKRIANIKCVNDGSMSFSRNKCVLKDKSWKSMFWKVNRFKSVNGLVWRKQESLVKDLQRIGKSYPNKTVVNIGGIMYKSTVNKLTRTKDKKQPSSHQFNMKPISRSCKINRVVYVRGEKFLIEDGGKKLIRQLNSADSVDGKKFAVRRVDIGGVTYIQKSNNVLIQTKTHQARHFVNYAKHKSIALLSSLHKRNNKPCMIYQRFGVCRRHTRGMCIYVHDPKNVALCKKFLKGDCKDSNCLLSHDVVEEKVATCHFFLKGNCQRDNCPFLHVKVNKRAAICVDFINGFCSLGQNCKKRHIHQCPDFDENGSCSRGVKCPYPHCKITKRKTKDGKTYKVSKFKLTENVYKGGKDKKTEGKTKKRVKKKTKTRKRKMNEEKSSLQESCNDSTIECIPKRVKLDNLPLYIPLNT